ncbi:MAG: hypothetical protein ACKV2T_13450 [Kofleriaceae bacterium]
MKHFIVAMAVLATPVIAHADAAAQLAQELKYHWGHYKTYRDDPGSRVGSLGHDPKPEECEAAVAKARKAGLKDDDKIYSREFNSFDEAEYDDKREAYITGAQAERVCKVWKEGVKLAPVAAMLSKLLSSKKTYSIGDDYSSLGKGMGDVFVKEGNDCFVAVDAAIAAGVVADRKVKIGEEMMTIKEARTKVCKEYLDWGVMVKGKIKESHAADREKRSAPYKAAGVAGAKLELFLEYDDVYWRGGANCQRIYEIKQLAKAKALFHWLENPDGTHSIRKYTFSGNKVVGTVTKTYNTAGAAQRGCK